MYREDLILDVKPIFEEHLKKGGFVLVDMRFYKNSDRQLVFEVLADREEGGITLDECTALNRELGDILENSGRILENYTLDVSSPGLDRPLVTSADFKRVTGREVRVFLREPVEGKIEHQGSVASADEGKAVLRLKEKTIEIPLEKVNKAKQVIP